MRKFREVAYVVAFVAIGASTAQAQTATQDINISATVPAACSINNAATGTAGTATIPVSVAGVVNAGAPGSGFTNIINYTASATWNSVTATLNTSTVATAIGNESGAQQAVATANSGNLTVSITPLAPSLPLITGAYADTLRVTLIPQ